MRAAIEAVHKLGPHTVLVTSVHASDTPRGDIDLIASGPDGVYRVRTPNLPMTTNGAGDAMAALFFAHDLRLGSTSQALVRAVSAIFGVLQYTAECGAREIQVVAAQSEIVEPSTIFAVERLDTRSI